MNGTCKNCGAEFEKLPRGRREFCSKKCSQTLYRATHKENTREYNANYKLSDEQKSNAKAYREEHREEIRIKKKVYYQENKQMFLDKAAEFSEENPEVVKGYKNKYAKTERGKDKMYENVRRRLARKRDAEGHFTRSQFRELCATHWNRCLCCGEKKKLEADHVQALARGGSDDISNIQPLCRNCNAQKATDTVDYRPVVTLASIAEEIDNHPAFRNQPLSIAQESRS